MTSVNPPTQYFPTIIYNPVFWNNTASSGQYLARVGTPTSIASNTTFTGAITTNDLTCVNVIQGTALNANNVLSTNNNANQTHYLTYVDLSTNGYGQLQKHATLTFNPNSEILTAETINATSSLQVGGININTIYLTIANALNDYARLGYNNTFLGTNHFQNNAPTINNSITTFSVNNLITKRYVDDSIAFIFQGFNSWTGKQTFTLYCPSTSVAPLTPNDLVNKDYIDNYVIGSSFASNTWTSSNEFVTALRTSVTAVASTDVINKSYADTNLSNSALLASSNTWTGSNTYNQAFNVSNRTISTGYNTSIDSKKVNIKADYDNNAGYGLFLQVQTPTGTFTGIEISQYALYAPISISTDFAQVQFNYPTFYASSAVVGAGASFQVGNVYGSASFVVFDGTFSISETNGQFLSNTLTALTNANPVTLYPSVTNSITIGNSASSQDVIINGNIKQKNYYRFKINPTLITSATTLSAPFYKINKFAMKTASGFTITLPDASTVLDMELTFKRQGGSLQLLTIAQVNSQPIFGIGNGRGQITSTSISATQSLVTLASTFVSPALTGNFTVTGQPTTTVNILSITSGADSYITVGTTLTLAVGVTRIITGYGTGNGGIGTYTVNTNITTNYTNQPYTATALYGWLALDLN
jgi:hypothetical protein